jgi:hypothetical protein
MSNQTRNWISVSAAAILAWFTALYTSPVSACELPTYFGSGITVSHHNYGGSVPGVSWSGTPTVSVGTPLDIECYIQASSRDNPHWSVEIYANGSQLMVRKSTAPDVRQNGVYMYIELSNWKVTQANENDVQCRLMIDGYSSQPAPRHIHFIGQEVGHSSSTTRRASPARPSISTPPARSIGVGGRRDQPHTP